MGTTTKMAIPYPEATGLVKDGWEDMKDIATQVDAKTGLVLLNTTSFSAVASQTVSNIFTSAFRNYFLTWESTGAAALYPNWRLATGGTPNSTTDYQYQRYESNSTSNTSQRTSGGTVFSLTSNDTNAFAATIYIFAPQVAEKTFVISHTIQNNSTTFTQPISNYSTGIFNATTQFDGVQLLPNTSTITGTLKVYGLN